MVSKLPKTFFAVLGGMATLHFCFLYMAKENFLNVSAGCVQCLVESIVFAIQYSALLWTKNPENVKQS